MPSSTNSCSEPKSDFNTKFIQFYSLTLFDCMPKNMTLFPQATTLLRTLWLAAIIIVVVGSLLPASSTPMRALAELHISDKLEHVGAYAVLAFLPAIHERRRFIIAAAIGTVLLGIGLEFGQLFTGWRDFEVSDMGADAVGVCIGIAAGISVRSSRVMRSFRSVGNYQRGDEVRAPSSPNGRELLQNQVGIQKDRSVDRIRL